MKDGVKTNYIYDDHGSVMKLRDSNGNVKNYDYDAFGNQTTSGIEDTNPFRYSGEYYDNETGNIYLRNRYYNPSLGRFINEDPIKDGLNWYVYCGNNPIAFIDPLGLFDWDTRLSYNQTYNDDVKVLQKSLVDRGYMSAPADGDWGFFGTKTQTAVNKYKADNDLGNTGKDAGVVGKQTWESLGLTYRTQEDIAAGVTISTQGFNQYKDISTPINNALNRDKGDFEAVGDISGSGLVGGAATETAKLAWFALQTGNRGRWNIKRDAATWQAALGMSFPGYNTQMLLYGDFVYVEDVGNITYGYLGAATGFSRVTLISGSAFNNAYTHKLSNWGNEIQDWVAIGKGFDWYKGAN